MIWLLATGVTLSVTALIGALLSREDPTVMERLERSARPERTEGKHRPRHFVPRFLPQRRVSLGGATTDLLDLLSVAVSAGLTPRLALDRAGTVLLGPLAAEVRSAAREVELGRPWRSALRGIAERTGDRDVARLALALERSERLGAPVATQLRGLARQVREEQRIRQEERARRAPVAMLFPLVFCILPAFLVAAVIPAVLASARGF